MKGSDLQKGVIELAHRYGWRVAHFHTAQIRPGVYGTPIAADGKGFPDLILVRDRVVAIEIKGTKDVLRPEQEEWLRAFRLAGVDTLVVTPKTWKNNLQLTKLLERRA